MIREGAPNDNGSCIWQAYLLPGKDLVPRNGIQGNVSQSFSHPVHGPVSPVSLRFVSEPNIDKFPGPGWSDFARVAGSLGSMPGRVGVAGLMGLHWFGGLITVYNAASLLLLKACSVNRRSSFPVRLWLMMKSPRQHSWDCFGC